MDYMVIVWLIVTAVLIVIEMFTLGITTIWFAGGSLVAMIAALFNAPLIVQILLFVVVSFILLLIFRPLAKKYLNKNTQKTNSDALIGKQCMTISEINNIASTGQVKVNDIEWTARSTDDSIVIPKDTLVEIESIQGVKLIVKNLD